MIKIAIDVITAEQLAIRILIKRLSTVNVDEAFVLPNPSKVSVLINKIFC